MKRYKLECFYCGNSWEADYKPFGPRCGKCNDTNIRSIDQSISKIDYYQGSPPFPEKEQTPPYEGYF